MAVDKPKKQRKVVSQNRSSSEGDYFRPHPDVLLRLEPGQEISLVLASKQTVFRLNPMGSLIWSLLDGETPYSEIVQILEKQFKSAPKILDRKQLGAFFKELVKQGLVQKMKKPASTEVRVKFPRFDVKKMEIASPILKKDKTKLSDVKIAASSCYFY